MAKKIQKFQNKYVGQSMKKVESVQNDEAQIETISGEVIVTKNPCSHPGDIRILKAIGKDDPRYNSLKHHVNIIVFPTQGQRPEQNKMSGGDLDGDVYSAIWDQDLVQSFKQQEPSYSKESQNNPIQQIQSDQITKTQFSDAHCDFFKKDLLGQLTNLWHAYCDGIGSQGPLDPFAKEISSMLQIQVDFAKHGECVTEEQYKKVSNKVKERPDFLESGQDMIVYESQNIIGKLYRQVKTEEFYDDCLKKEYQYSFQSNFNLNHLVVGQKHNTEENLKKIITFSKYLPIAYETIVLPMVTKIKDLMSQYKLINEAELFCTDLKFKSGGQDSQDYIGDISKNKEDISREIQTKIDKIKLYFRNELKNHTNKDEDKKRLFASAVYFATYFHTRNNQCQRIMTLFDKEQENYPDWKEFVDLWKNNQRKEYDQATYDQLFCDFPTYKKVCKQSEDSTDKQSRNGKLKHLLNYKQIFCVPWLLCYEDILNENY